jgi:ABC-type sugar transport system ATPase subunit
MSTAHEVDRAAPSVQPPVLEIRHVSKHFGAIRALEDITVEIRAGEILGLVGDNGAGKSTLVKIVSGVHRPTSGEVLLDGRPVSFASPAEARAEGIETVYQDLALVDTLDVAANFFLGRELTAPGLGRLLGVMRVREMRRQADQAVKDLHIKIPGIRSEKVAQMSGGQRQAVAIARAAFWKRRLLLLDEPTAALGVEESGEVLRIMREMARQQVPMLVISHNMEEVWTVCDRILVLRQGQQVAVLDKSETSPQEIVGYITGALGKRRTSTDEPPAAAPE